MKYIFRFWAFLGDERFFLAMGGFALAAFLADFSQGKIIFSIIDIALAIFLIKISWSKLGVKK
jgi:hypothetical protein